MALAFTSTPNFWGLPRLLTAACAEWLKSTGSVAGERDKDLSSEVSALWNGRAGEGPRRGAHIALAAHPPGAVSKVSAYTKGAPSPPFGRAGRRPSINVTKCVIVARP